MPRRWYIMLWVCGFLTAACSTGDPLLSADPGGAATTELNNREAFGQPIRGLTEEERASFEIGNAFFDATWTPAGQGSDATDGLGPLFSAASCAACHVRNGRAAPGSPGFVLRVSTIEGAPLPAYGSQIQDQAVDGVPPEAVVLVTYREEHGAYADGSAYTLRAPVYSLREFGYGPTGTILSSPRVAPSIFGMGLIEAVPATDIAALADPDDADRDGVSGRLARLEDGSIGRFGWKANVPTIGAQVALAFHRDMGVTSPAFPLENCLPVQAACATAPSGGHPELTGDRLDRVISYASALAVPQRRNLDEAEVIAGAALFESLGCTSCHTPRHRTGDYDIEALAHQDITPFSDLLLHDMGEGLADGRPDGAATGSEWRTTPLWGLGLVEEVNGHLFLLHDGRARSIEEAILWHGGEGAPSRDRFAQLSEQDRRRLLEFLGSL